MKMMKISDLKIKTEYKNIIVRPTEEDMIALKEDIKKNGIKLPLNINENNVVLDGHTRLEIAEALGISEVPVGIRKFKNKREEIYFIFQINIFRRHLTTAQRVEVGLKLSEFVKVKTKQNHREHDGKTASKKESVRSEPTNVSGKTRDIAAKWMKLSSKTVQQGKMIKNTIKNLEDRAKAGELENDWDDALAGKKYVKTVYRKAKKFKEEESGEPKKVPSIDDRLIKEYSNIRYKVKTIQARDIKAIQDKKDREIVIQTLQEMIEHLTEQLKELESNKTEEKEAITKSNKGEF